jgi:molybdate transport system substrate-binding protein
MARLNTRPIVLCVLFALLLPLEARAEEVTAAVAANFVGTLKDLQPDFETRTSHKLTIISGATGKLTAQIMEGAPFDVFLSADDKAPKKLVEAGKAVLGSEFTYAMGTLALFSSDPGFIEGDGEAVLKAGNFSKLALANPKVAPYGAAAMSVLEAFHLADSLKGKIVMGENVGQTFQLVDSGNAQLGFVALSQVLESASGRKGSYWTVPENLHAAIRQNAVLLTRAADNPAAGALLDFLQSPPVKTKISSAGYATEDN